MRTPLSSVCYAPLILLCWLKFTDARRGAQPVWLGAMVVANWMVMNSGTVKEAYILLLAMNAWVAYINLRYSGGRQQKG